jgi:hypothetical protein
MISPYHLFSITMALRDLLTRQFSYGRLEEIKKLAVLYMLQCLGN